MAVTDSPLEASMLDALDGANVAIDPIAGAWSVDEVWEEVSLHGFVSFNEGGFWVWSWSFHDPQALLEGEIAFPDLRRIPGWDPMWELPLDRERRVTLDAYRGGCSTGWSQTFE